MWTATIIEVRPMANGQEAVCVLTNGKDDKFQQCYQTDGTVAMLTAQLRATVAARVALTAKPELSAGLTFDSLDVPIA